MNRKLRATVKQWLVNLSEGCTLPGKLQLAAMQPFVNLSEGCCPVLNGLGKV